VAGEARSENQIANSLEAQVVEHIVLDLKIAAGSVPAQAGNFLCVLNVQLLPDNRD
jgi:hypothetical protein